MAGITIRSVLRRLTSLIVWLIVAALVTIPTVFLTSKVFVPAFSTRTLVPADQPVPAPGPNSPFYLSWQEPSQYTAAVFASQYSQLPTNVSVFFENAELLWQISPQSLADRYPTLRKRASVKVPAAVIEDRTKNRGLFMHIFAWQLPADSADSASAAVPDMQDPYLVHAASQLVRWDTPIAGLTASSGFPGSISSTKLAGGSGNGGGSKLVAAKSVSWATSFENHAYTMANMPRHISKTLSPSSVRLPVQNKRYNPPMFVNSFTQDIPKPADITSSIKKNDARINVDIELRGIKQGWITSKNKLVRVFEPGFFRIPPGGGGNKNDSAIPLLFLALTTLVYSFVSRLGVPSLLTIIYSLVFLFVFSYLYIRAKSLFWLSPSTRWVGYSRIMYVIYFVASLAGSTSALVSMPSAFISFLFIQAFQLYILLILTETPLNPMTWYPRIRKAMQSARQSSDNNGAYSLVEIESEEAGSEPASPKTLEDVEYVVSARKDIDSVALWWTTRLFFPLLGLVIFYCIVTHSEFKTQVGTFAYIMKMFANVLLWIHWLPQVFVNYRTKCGTWIPVTANAYEIAATALALLAIGVSGYSLPLSTIMNEVPNHIFNVVLVYQWLFYRFKQ